MSLFERAGALVPPTEFDVALESELCDTLYWTGKSDEALRRADALAERASVAGDRVCELCGRVLGGVLRLLLEPEGATERLAALLKHALPVFDAAGEDLALFIAYDALGVLAGKRDQADASLEAYERAVAHYARQAGHLPSGSMRVRGACRFFGTTPLLELVAWLDENEPQHGRDHFLRAYRAGALAMLGRFHEARAILAETRAELAERGGGLVLAHITTMSVWVELWAGDPAVAAEFGAKGWGLYEELGDQTFLSSAAADLARALYPLDRLDEADDWAGRAAELGAGDDPKSEMVWRQVRAKVLARRSEPDEAERLAREAIAAGENTDWLNGQGDAYADLAEVLALADRPQEAVGALEQALTRYERKENIVMAERVRARLTGLRSSFVSARRA